MSYDLSLVDKDGKTFPMPGSEHVGGTMPVGGYVESDFNITYNYGWFYRQCLDKEQGLRWLYGKTGAETIERLEKAIEELGTNRWYETDPKIDPFKITEDDKVYKYWTPTPGNAGAALVPLLEAAKRFSEGKWVGD